MTRTPRLAAAAAATALGAATIAGCGSSGYSSSSDSKSTTSSSASSSSAASPSESKSSGGSSSSQTAKIMIKDYKYSGDTDVAPGTQITITNADDEAHTVTDDKGGAFDVNIAPGKSATLTAPGKAGSYAYHCTYHSDMHGTLKVG